MRRLSERISSRNLALKRLRSERIDRWFIRASHLSQVLLLALGVFGYFYTVLPIYQKSLLDEDIAQKTLELREKERLANALELQIAARTTELKEKDRLLAGLQQQTIAAEQSERKAKADAQAATRDAYEQYQKLRKELVTSYSERLSICSLNRILDRRHEFAIEENTFRICIEQHLTKIPQELAQLKEVDRVKYADTANRLLVEFQPAYQESYLRLHKEEVDAKAEGASANARYKVAEKEAGNDRNKRATAYNELYPPITKALERHIQAKDASWTFFGEILRRYIQRLAVEALV